MDEKQQAIENAKKRIAIKQAKERLAKATMENPLISDEIHPGFSPSWENRGRMGTRFNMKNFGNPDSEEYIQAYQKAQPDMQFKKINGNIYAMDRNAGPNGTWKPADPPGVDLQDVSDSAYDLITGTVQGAGAAAAGTVGGALGFLSPIPGGTTIGALGGASAAGAGLGRGAEQFRQRMGRWTGASKTPDEESVDYATLAGAVIPPVLGGGASSKQIARWTGGLLKEEGKQAVENAMKAPIMRAADTVFPKALSAFSRVPEGTIRYTSANPAELKMAERSAKEEGKDYAGRDTPREFIIGINEKVKKKVKDAGDAIEAALPEVKGTVDITDAVAPMQKMVKKYEDEYLKELAELEAIHGPKEAANMIKKKGSYKNHQTAKDAADQIVPVNPIQSPISVNERKKQATAMGKANKRIDAAGEASPIGQDVVNAARQTGKNLDNEILTLEGGDALKQTQKQYRDSQDLKKQVKYTFGDFDKNEAASVAKTEQVMTSLVGNGNASKKQYAKDISENLGEDITEEANKAMMNKYFINPNWLPEGGASRSTLTAGALGAGAGMYAADQSGAPTSLGLSLGAGAGALLSGPAATKAYLKAVRGLSAPARVSRDLGPSSIATPINTGAQIWSNLYNNEEK